MFERPALPLWHPATLIATWFGAGLIRGAPGTWGSLAALPCPADLHLLGGPWLLAGALASALLLWLG
jgi:phosphatidylglycerophosphatase A